MRVIELRAALVEMGNVSKRLEAANEAKALQKLADILKPYDDKTVTQFLSLANRRKPRMAPNSRTRKKK